MLDGLLPSFQNLIENFTEKLNVTGIRYRLINGYRSGIEQAKLWRQGRSTALIMRVREELRAKGEKVISGFILDAGPQTNPYIVTHALPFQSPHQFGCALDLVPYYGNLLLWDNKLNQKSTDVDKLWKTCGQLSKECGLEWGGDWRYFKDRAHYQHPQYEKKKKQLYRLAITNPNLSAEEVERVLGV